MKILRVPPWSSEGWLLHAFSTRSGGVSHIAGASPSRGDLNLGFTKHDTVEAVSANRESFLRASAAISDSGAEWGLVTLKQMHSALLRRVGRADATEQASLWGDGLISDEPGILLGIQTADCLPILIADRQRRAVGAFHAGWRGTLKGIVQMGVAAMGREFGSLTEDLTAAIGPGIGQCCFAVGTEVRQLFAARYSYASELFNSGDNRLTLDLAEANRRQLRSAGLTPDAIFSFDSCTSCHTEEFFSYRAERGRTGRMMAVIGISPP